MNRLFHLILFIKHLDRHTLEILLKMEQITLKDWQKLAFEKIYELNNNGKLPIIVGGTGLYINSIMYNSDIDNYLYLAKYIYLGSLRTLSVIAAEYLSLHMRGFVTPILYFANYKNNYIFQRI